MIIGLKNYLDGEIFRLGRTYFYFIRHKEEIQEYIRKHKAVK